LHCILQVSELTQLGGKTLSRIINKMLKKIFDDTILIKFTYYGLRNKGNFHTLSINKAILIVKTININSF